MYEKKVHIWKSVGVHEDEKDREGEKHFPAGCYFSTASSSSVTENW